MTSTGMAEKALVTVHIYVVFFSVTSLLPHSLLSGTSSARGFLLLCDYFLQVAPIWCPTYDHSIAYVHCILNVCAIKLALNSCEHA